VWFGYGLLVLDLVALACCLAYRSAGWAWLLLVTSALWLPANNRVLEGPTLLSVGQSHGLTASDLIGLGGVCVAAVVLVRHSSARGRRRTTSVTVALCGLAVVVGAGLAYLTS
jgi:hypothetical protein